MGTWRGVYVWRDDPGLVGLNRQIMAARPDPGRPLYGNTGSGREAPCGTTAAYRRHRRRHEPACEACRAAERLWHQLRKEARGRAA